VNTETFSALGFVCFHLADNSPKILFSALRFLECCMSIYIGNLSYEVTQEDITQVFSEYGTVKRVQLPTDRETGRMRGFGFVEMETEAQEAAAIDALDGAEWMGRDLRVNKAKPREERPSSGGGGWGNSRRGGGGGGRRY
jgi:RNA recognition motif-containing protein